MKRATLIPSQTQVGSSSLQTFCRVKPAKSADTPAYRSISQPSASGFNATAVFLESSSLRCRMLIQPHGPGKVGTHRSSS